MIINMYYNFHVDLHELNLSVTPILIIEILLNY